MRNSDGSPGRQVWWRPGPSLLLLMLSVLVVGVALPERGRAQAVATLTVGLAVEPIDLDPQNALNVAEISLARLLFQGLFTTDTEGNVHPALARELPTRANGGISADGLRVTVRLREGLRWGDGTPLTADDVAYGILRGAAPQLSASFAYLLYPIAGAEAYATALDDRTSTPTAARIQALRSEVGVRAPDGTTIEITLREPRPDLLWLLANWMTVPVQQRLVEGSGPAYNSDWSIPGILVGNGPYLLRGWEPRRSLTLEANPRYAGPAPRTGRIVFRFYRNQQEAMAAALSGEVDIADVPPIWQDLARDAGTGGRVLPSPLQSTFGIVLNQAAPLNDARVRLALAKALNRESLVAALGPVGLTAATCWIPPGVVAVPEGGCDAQRRDLVEARMLLAAAGYPEGRGLRPLEFVVERPADALIGDAVAAQLRADLGVEVRVVTRSLAGTAGGASAPFDLRVSNWTADYAHIENWLDPFFTPAGPFNYGGYRNPAVDALFARARATEDRREQAALYAEIQTLALRDVAVIPWSYLQRYTYAGPRVRGLTPNVQDFVFGGDFLLPLVSVE